MGMRLFLICVMAIGVAGALIRQNPAMAGDFMLVAHGDATPAPPSQAAALRAAVQTGRDPELRWSDFTDFRSEIARLYERAGWRPVWFRGTRPSDAAIQLIARLANSDSLGLDPLDYDAWWLRRRLRGLSQASAPDDVARFDLALSVAAVRFVSALHRGRLNPREVNAALFIPRPSLAAEMAVDSLLDAARQGLVLANLQPRFHHYQLLKNALVRYRSMARDSSLVPLPGLPAVVRPGMPLRAAARLRHLLEATGDIASSRHRAATDTLYSRDLVAGIRQFQRRQGFEADGVIGPATIERLNRPFDQRVRQIELTLERWRWLPESFTAPPIIVNIPAYRLFAFTSFTDREDSMLAMDVVVGSAFKNDTPVFAADMRYLIFRPYWEVPARIMLEELGPKAFRDPKFLEQERMILVQGESDSAPALPPTPENLERIGKDLRVRQLPGPLNALGLIKFVLPNAYDVYLHDTAAKGLFSRARRDLSHGCIRVRDPVALAAYVLRDQPQWTPERIRGAMGADDGERVDLTRPIPVYIVYATAIAGDRGEMYFYSDVYGLDRKLDELLRKGYPYPN